MLAIHSLIWRAYWRVFHALTSAAPPDEQVLARTVGGVAMRSNVLDLDGDDITTTKFAIDCQVEHGKVAHSPFELEPRPY
jgi:hypothetical protein